MIPWSQKCNKNYSETLLTLLLFSKLTKKYFSLKSRRAGSRPRLSSDRSTPTTPVDHISIQGLVRSQGLWPWLSQWPGPCWTPRPSPPMPNFLNWSTPTQLAWGEGGEAECPIFFDRDCRSLSRPTLPLPRVINFKFPLQPRQEYYITQYEGLGFSSLTQMKDDYTTNSHYLIYTFLFKLVGRMYLLSTSLRP